MTIAATAHGPAVSLSVAPAFPLDARVRAATVDGADVPFRARAEGDVQRVEVEVPAGASGAGPRTIAFAYDEGSDTFTRVELPEPGATSAGLRVLRSRAEGGALHLLVEGLGGRAYA